MIVLQQPVLARNEAALLLMMPWLFLPGCCSPCQLIVALLIALFENLYFKPAPSCSLCVAKAATMALPM